MSEQTQHEAWAAWLATSGNFIYNHKLLIAAKMAFKAGWRAAKEDERNKPDPFAEAFNSGDGSYRP